MKIIRPIWFFIPSLALFLLLVAQCAKPALPDTVEYPRDYRDWSHVKSMAIHPGHALFDPFGGIHHVYANDTALQALKTNQSFPDGSVFVFDLLEAKTENNTLTEGPRKILGVMYRNRKAFPGTDGWGYEGFVGDTQDRAVKDGGTSCHACHVARKEQDFVFSEYRK